MFDLSRSIFVPMSKKTGAEECELHRTIKLMSILTKLTIRILMNRTRNRIRREIGYEQCGFFKDNGGSSAIFMLRMLQKERYKCRMTCT